MLYDILVSELIDDGPKAFNAQIWQGVDDLTSERICKMLTTGQPEDSQNAIPAFAESIEIVPNGTTGTFLLIKVSKDLVNVMARDIGIWIATAIDPASTNNDVFSVNDELV